MAALKKNTSKKLLLEQLGCGNYFGDLFAGSWTGQFVNQLQVEQQNAQEHGQQLKWKNFIRNSEAQPLKTGNLSGYNYLRKPY